MQPSTMSPPVAAPVPAAGLRSRTFWTILLGGLLAAIGLVLEFAPSLTRIGGTVLVSEPFPLWLAVEFAGFVIEAFGLFVAFVGIAMGLRAPAPASALGIRGKVFWTILLGGLMILVAVAATITVTTTLTLGFLSYSIPLMPAFYMTMVGLQALGFFVAFFGIAVAFRART